MALGAVTPQGWLAEQLRIQARGLSGHLDRFWPDIKGSAWIGGAAEGWERMPYWLDGVIPLAWMLRDQPLQQRITGYLDYIIEHQHGDGWLGPRVEDNPVAADLWSQALALKVLVGYHDATGDNRVAGCIERALAMLDRHLDRNPLSQWGQYRWFEFLVSIWWLYERSGERWLIDLARRLRAQGFNWQLYFEQWPRTGPTAKGRWCFDAHVVNNAMALKEGALWWRLTGAAGDRGAADRMLPALDRHHGMATGVFSRTAPVAGAGTFHAIERSWSDGDEVALRLPMTPRLLQRPRDAVSLARGPLLYALRIGERWQRINQDQPHREPPHADWEVYPTSPWNFALELGDGELNEVVRFTEHSLGSPVFAPATPPVSATVKGRRVPEWGAEGGSAAPPPAAPVRNAGPDEDLTLIPYGCSNLRIAEFPVL